MSSVVVFVHEVWIMNPPLDYPVVTREFRGETREEARACYLAHYEADSALRRCVEQDEYLESNGAIVKCSVRAWFDDDDARVERVARAWIAARHRRAIDLFDAVPPEEDESNPSPNRSMSTPRVGFQPRVIEGGANPMTTTKKGWSR